MLNSQLYRERISITEELINSYQQVEEALVDLISEPKRESESDAEHKYRIGKLKVELFDVKGALTSQQFHLDEYKRKNEEYHFFLETLRNRIEEEWKPTIIKLKQKQQQRLKKGKGIQDLSQVIDRCDEPFESEEEKLEHFRAMLDMSEPEN